ncbi:MAG TPA: nucleoside recognition domain-containing protein [Ignavibacteriaceae bacterium]|nr:nucleoside recognition domain-containing protein [Ignavibacteriaceae bacterium]
MLNYVWLSLLILGIGAGVYTDLHNQNTNKYRNGNPLPILINYQVAEDRKGSNAEINIKKETFNSFYNENIKEDLKFPAKVSIDKNKRSGVIYFIVEDSFPQVWKEMGSVNGEKNDLTGKLVLLKEFSEKTISAELILEEASFIKLKEITNSALEYAGNAVNISLGLIGIMALWLGVMKVAEEAGLIKILAGWLRPLTKKLFPDVPSDHPAMGSMIMNISANMLGLGNAATPFGLKAMEELDKLNPDKGTATNAMVTFLAINTAGMTLIPATAIAIRAASGSSNPAIIIGTSLVGSGCATIAGLTAAKILEKFPLEGSGFSGWASRYKKRLAWFAGIILLLFLIFFTGLGASLGKIFGFINPSLFREIIQVISIIAIPLFIIFFIGYGAIKKVRVYEQFVEGAKEGFNIAVRIIPYLVAMLMAIAIFRAGGAMDWLIYILHPLTNLIGMPVEALPMALMRPLSGNGSLGIMAEIISVHGPDSLIGIMVSTFYGSTETTFYILAVYFGAVNIKNTRHALPVGLIADICGILAATFIVNLLFG